MRATALLAAVAALALPAAAQSAERFTDPAGDAGAGPDIAAVTLAHTDEDLTIAVEFAQAPPLGWDEGEQYTDMLLVGIHTDDDLRQRDVEFYTGVHGVDLTRAPIVRANTAGPRSQIGRATVEVDGATLTLTLKRSLLDDPEEIAVAVAAGREYSAEESPGGSDEAPATGPYRYALTDGGVSWVWPALAGGLAAAALAAALVVANCRRRPLGRRDGALAGGRR